MRDSHVARTLTNKYIYTYIYIDICIFFRRRMYAMSLQLKCCIGTSNGCGGSTRRALCRWRFLLPLFPPLLGSTHPEKETEQEQDKHEANETEQGSKLRTCREKNRATARETQSE